MKVFWPRRSNVKGFAIENVASKYPKNISSDVYNLNQKQLIDEEGVLKSKNKDSISIDFSHLSIKTFHWANRDFSEYKEPF